MIAVASIVCPPTVMVGLAMMLSGVELVEVVLGAIGGGDVVDQAFVERPGVHPAFPLVDDEVAEAERFGLHVGHPRRAPGFARRV